MSSKKIKLGPVEILISTNDNIVEKVHENIFYRHIIRPVLNFFSALTSNTYSKSIPKKPLNAQHKDKINEKSAEHKHILIPKELLGDNQQTASSNTTPEQKAVLERITDIEWYHSINLGHGVITPGAFDHHPYLSDYYLPERLDGMRVLDVATFDGFWAFEFERRGAAKVVALDIEKVNDLDLPPVVKAKMSEEELEKISGKGFERAREILGSKVHREILNVYDISPDRLGKFDIVFCGDLLLHLMNPMKALQNIYSVVTQYALIIDIFDPNLDQYGANNTVLHHGGGIKGCIWWVFSKGCLKQMILNAGFRKVELLNEFELGLSSKRNADASTHHVVFKAYP